MSVDANYASTDATFRVSAKRFAQSPWLASYITPESILGVYSGRFYALSVGNDPLEDYWHLRREVALFDVPEHPIQIAGAGARAYLNRLFCRDISKLRIGRATYAIACNHDGGILMDGVLMRVAQDSYWYVLADGEFLGWMDACRPEFDVQVSDPNSWVLQLQGPRSLDLLADLLGDKMFAAFKYFSVHECELNGEPFYISRTGWTGELGFELYSRNPAIDGAKMMAYLLEAGAPHGLRLCALEAMGIRRIEAGIMDNGTDMNSSMTPFAAGLTPFVDLDKTDHIGAAALRAADKRGRFFGISAAHGTPIGRHKIECDTKVVGELTAAGRSPYLQKFVAYARFFEPDCWLGKTVTLRTDAGDCFSAEVVSLPFYDPQKRIPRGLALDNTV